jgi:uncharacterized protein (TIGR04562 family)
MDNLRGELMTQKITPEDFEKKVMELNIEPPPAAADNSHSGDLYSAIQLTGRQLVRHTRPLTILKDRLHELSQSKAVTKELALCFEEMTAVMNNIARIGGDEEFAFFPFEIQIMDRQSWENNTHGKASHSRYKRSQIRAARRRVLNEILPLS